MLGLEKRGKRKECSSQKEKRTGPVMAGVLFLYLELVMVVSGDEGMRPVQSCSVGSQPSFFSTLGVLC